MLFTVHALTGYSLHTLDGEIGKALEFYFDDQLWTIRYLVADAGSWLKERNVLISPHALNHVNRDDRRIAVDLTRKQIADSPPLSADKPVSKQYEMAFYNHYGYPVYWDGPHRWGPSPLPVGASSDSETTARGAPQADANLRSTQTVRGYHVEASDGSIGHVEDFIVDDRTWTIRYLIIDTRNWLPGKRVLVSPEWIGRVSWSDATVSVNLPRERIEKSPEYTEKSLLNREYETGLHHHYDRQGYWIEEVDAAEPAR